MLKLGIYQIASGFIGFIFAVLSLFSGDGINIVLIGLVLLFCGFSIYSGYLCMENRQRGLGFSRVNQILQIFQFASPWFAFKFASGIYVAIGVSPGSEVPLALDFGLFKLAFSVCNGQDVYEFSINVVAIALVLWISKLIKTVEKEARHHALADLPQ